MRSSPFRRGQRGAREATLREEPRLASPCPPLPLHGGKEGGSTRDGKQHAEKTPTWNGRGRHRHAAAPFPRKDVSAPCRAGLLARGMSLLSAPSQGDAPQWSLQISFRSQLRGSDGFAPSSLVTVADCHQPYQRHMQFCVRAYGSPLRFVKKVSEASGVWPARSPW